MRASWILAGALLVVALAGAFAVPIDGETESSSTGSKTIDAIRNFFSPMTDYFMNKLPEKTPGEVATDVKDKVDEVKEWALEKEAIQTLVASLRPVRNWLREKADVLEDKTFREMYEDVRTRVSNIDDKIGEWIDSHNNNEAKSAY